MNYITEYLHILWNILLEMSPWLLLGFFFSGILHAFFPKQLTAKHLGKNNMTSVIKAALLGVPLPLCSCGVIPTSVSLYKNGASKSATTSFLISTPQTGVDSILAIYALMGFPFAIIKPVIAFLSGIFGGFIGTFAYKNEEITSVHVESEKESTKTFQEKVTETFRYGFITMVRDLYKWLIIGILLAAAITLFVPDDFFINTIDSVWLEFLVVLAIAIPLYVCATGSIPIALSLLLKGLSPGASVLFLMVGPATNIATLVVLQKSLGKKFTFIYVISIIVSGLFFAFIVNEFIPKEWLFQGIDFSKSNSMQHQSLLATISSIVLLGLIAFTILTKIFKKYANKKTNTMKTSTTFSVEGMTCNHCKINVEKNLRNINGVTQIEADIDKKQVYIEGDFDEKTVTSKIEELGYKVK